MAPTGGKIDVKELLTLKADPPAARRCRSEMERLVMHLDAAYRLARWLLPDETEAEDAVQEAYREHSETSRAFAGETAGRGC
jgi:DNA-directed RNA polymerase specialized sigma24 family protein